MVALAGDGTMAKKGRPRTGRDEVPIKIDRMLASRLKTIASYRGVPLGELLTELAGKAVERAYLKMVKEMESKSKDGEA